MSLSSRARLLVSAALLLGLAACGFQLRGSVPLPEVMAVTWVDTPDRYSPFYQRLVTVLRQNRITLAETPTEARTVIRVLADDTDRRLLTVSSRNVPTEYEVYYRVRFAVVVDGQEVAPAEQLALSRDFTFDETRVLGKAAEERMLRDALAADLVNLVTRRLSAIRAPGEEGN
jgi:LPS-assembly lipoprotein